MKLKKNYLKYISGRKAMAWTLLLVMGLTMASCKKMLNVGTPGTSSDAELVFSTDALAISSITGLYVKLINQSLTATAAVGNLSLYAGLSADELTLFSPAGENEGLNGYYSNTLRRDNVGTEIWINAYNLVANANRALEGLEASSTLNAKVKTQLLGEARFIRAFCYFYLLNLYGDVPLLVTTDYKVNSAMSRTDKTVVWQQIINDLIAAQTELSPDFLGSTLLTTSTERVRPTRWAATALLARAYLYTGNWAGAEVAATAIIEKTAQFEAVPQSLAFLKNSREAIWQLQPTRFGENTPEARTFILPASGPTVGSTNPVHLSPQLLAAFEPGDQRRVNWVGTITTPDAKVYAYPFKYKLSTTSANSVSEYTTVLRIGEQFLIRAEARARLNKLTGAGSAESDLNVIRARAGLGGTTASGQAQLISAILHERQVELFSEWGHRWLDLKRLDLANQVMATVTPDKGGIWRSEWQLYPIRQSEIDANSKLTQNQRY